MQWTLITDVAHYAHNVSHQSTENFLLHTHETYEIYYFISGDVDYLVEGKEYRLKPHTLLAIGPNLFHGVRVHTNATYERHTLHFDPNLLSIDRWGLLLSVFPNARRQIGRPVVYCLENMEHSGVLGILHAIEASVGKDERVQKMLLAVLTEALLSLLLLCAPTEDEEVPQERGRVSRTQREIIEYLNAHFTESVTLDALAEKFFISKHYLNRVFRKATGTTVMDYLIYKRVTYVQQLLVNGVPISQAAAMAGFGDYTTFYRAYVKRFGHAPSQDRPGQERSHATDVFRIRGVLRDQARNGMLDVMEEDRVYDEAKYDGWMNDNVRFWMQHAPRRAKPQIVVEDKREENDQDDQADQSGEES